MKFRLTLLSALSVLAVQCSAKPEAGNPVEVGNVNWERKYDAVLAKAKKEDKPIFALFQEVPG